jgi:hypothetical protein
MSTEETELILAQQIFTALLESERDSIIPCAVKSIFTDLSLEISYLDSLCSL